MARIPEFVRRNPISQVAAGQGVPAAGAGWKALADIAGMGAKLMEPAAMKQAGEAGLNSVSRDAQGNLQVTEMSPFAGPLGEAFNTAGYAKYLAQKQLDISATFSELAIKHKYDPAGFQQASDAALKLLGEESIPAPLKADLQQTMRQEGQRWFNGLQQQQVSRTEADADKATTARRGQLAQDYARLVAAGDDAGAQEVWGQIQSITDYRVNTPSIHETPEAAASVLSGYRGDAKASLMNRQVASLTGDPEKDRPVIERLKTQAENDPDLDPQQRQSLWNRTDGAMKMVDATVAAQSLTDSSYAAKVTRVESGGDAAAKNPLSSATGLHQFTSGTWMESVRQLQAQGGAQWADGLSKDEILEMRKNPAASAEVFAKFTADNQAGLAGAGLPVNDATTYLAHFLGLGGAKAVLTADPAAMAADVLGGMIPGFAEANPDQGKMTVGELRNWAARKMTVKASDMAAQTAIIQQIPDPEVRQIAMQVLTGQINARSREEASAADAYELRIADRDMSLSTQGIASDQNLSDNDQARLISAWREQGKKQEELTDTLARIESPAAWDASLADSTGRVDRLFESAVGDGDPLAPENTAVAFRMLGKTGHLPQRMFGALVGEMESGDPQRFMRGAEALSLALKSKPTALDGLPGADGARAMLDDYRFYSGMTGGTEGAARAIEAAAADRDKPPKNVTENLKVAVKNLKPKDIVDELSRQSGLTVTLPDFAQEGAMADYQRIFEDEFLKTGDAARARFRALQTMTRTWGPESISGENRLMRFPPQNFYAVPWTKDTSWMRDQLTAAVSEHLDGEGVSAKNIRIYSNTLTREGVAAGKDPRYEVWYEGDNGEYHPLPHPFYFERPAQMGADHPMVRAEKLKEDMARIIPTPLAADPDWAEQEFQDRYGSED